jgi:serine/threonine protein phosphatase PrpC
VVALIHDEVLLTAHTGDSRAVLCRDGAAVRLTEDHKPNVDVERKRIEAAGGEVVFLGCWRASHPTSTSYLACSRAIGDLLLKRPHEVVTAVPELTTRKLQPGDQFVVLASDGLWDVVDDATAVKIVLESMAADFLDGVLGALPTAPNLGTAVRLLLPLI